MESVPVRVFVCVPIRVRVCAHYYFLLL